MNVHYLPIHLQPYYRKMGFKKGDFYNSEKHSESCLSIPIYPDLKLEEINKVIRLISYYFVDKIIHKELRMPSLKRIMP